MKYIEAVEKIKKGQISNTYLLHGNESYLIESVLAEILSQTVSKEDAEQNIIKYDLEDVSIQDVLLEVETYPFFGEKKVVLAYHPLFLTSKVDKTGVNHDVDRLLAYLEEPVDFTTFIIVAPYEKLDERKKVTKSLKRQAALVSCEEVKEWDVAKWVDHIAKSFHITLEKAVYDLLIQEAGNHLSILQKELEKLALYVGENGTVTLELAENLIAHQANTSGLKLVDTIMAKDLSKSIRIYKDLVQLNEEIIALVALLASQLRTIYQVKVLMKKGYSQKQMAQQLKVHPFVVKMAAKRERLFTFDRLNEMISKCAETDAQIKQGRMEKGLAFELLLYQLTQ